MRAKWIAIMACAAMLAGAGEAAAQAPMPPVGGAHVHEARIAALEAQMASLAPVLELIESGRMEVITNDAGITALRLMGINLQVVNGLGVTAGPTTNGTGNVIIGYDEVRTEGEPSCSTGRYADEASCVAAGYVWGVSFKSGSHYLVVGPENNYGRFSGIVVGITRRVPRPRA